MPDTRAIRSPASDSLSGRMIGIAPPTAASNSSGTPRRAAASTSSRPRDATNSLLAVTTGLPAFERSEDEIAGRIAPPDHLDDEINVRVHHDRHRVVGEHPVRQG